MYFQQLFYSHNVAWCPQLDSSVIRNHQFSLIFLSLVSGALLNSRSSSQDSSDLALSLLSCAQHQRGSVYVRRQTVKGDGGPRLTSLPPHDLFCLTSCFICCGFRQTAKGSMTCVIVILDTF